MKALDGQLDWPGLLCVLRRDYHSVLLDNLLSFTACMLQGVSCSTAAVLHSLHGLLTWLH
jgi:hypothetical protein